MKIIIYFALILVLLNSCNRTVNTSDSLCDYDPKNRLKMSLDILSEKEINKMGEPIYFFIKANLVKEDPCIEIVGCNFWILNRSMTEEDEQYSLEVLNSKICAIDKDELQLLKSKSVENLTLIWKQNNCILGQTSNVRAGDYSAIVSCSYQDRHGSSWEGIYHSSIKDFTNFRII